jgi:DNA (cytosine-5)-methyltransferase 1
MLKPKYEGYTLHNVLENEKQEKFKVFSLFAGGGGSSTGYRLAGGKVLAINEFIDQAVETYRANYPATKIYHCDIRTLEPKQVLQDLKIEKGELDILDGSPPCSAFSIAGKREAGWGKSKKYSDKAQRVDNLFNEYVRFVNEIQPKVFVAENVKGMALGNAKSYLKQITDDLTNCGYAVKAKILNAASFGVPQIRERLIIIGVRKDLYKEEFADKFYPVPKTYSYCWNDVAHEFLNQPIEKETGLNELTTKYWKLTPEGRGFDDASKIITGKNSWFNFRKLGRNKPANTITAMANSFHPTKPRRLSVYETQVLMTLPRDYKNEGNYRQRIERCGRMVPPLLIKAVAENLYTNILSKL